jgi:hypothetical protein
MLFKLMWLIEIYLNDTYSKDCVDKNLSQTFPTKINMKEHDTLSPLLFIFTLAHVLIKIQ